MTEWSDRVRKVGIAGWAWAMFRRALHNRPGKPEQTKWGRPSADSSAPLKCACAHFRQVQGRFGRMSFNSVARDGIYLARQQPNPPPTGTHTALHLHGPLPHTQDPPPIRGSVNHAEIATP